MLPNDYIVGLVDGEGSFTVYVRDPERTDKTVRRVRAEPKFYIKLVDKDRSILESVHKFFGCGRVYFQKDARPNHQNCYRFEVNSREDLAKTIIPFFKANQLRFPSKKNDFDLFCKMFTMIQNGEHLTKLGLKQLFRLKQQMH